MDLNQIIAKANESPALKYQSNEGGRANYPANFRGRVPLKVKVAKTVLPDALPFIPIDLDFRCEKDCHYYVWVDSYGAVCAILPNGKQLGLKPSEFDVIEWHNMSPNGQAPH